MTDNVVLGIDSEHLTGLMAHSLEFEDAFVVVGELGNLEDDASALDLAGTELPVDAVQEASFLLPGDTEVAEKGDHEEVVVAPADVLESEGALLDEVVAVG